MQWFLIDRWLLAIGRLLLAAIICLVLYELSPGYYFLFPQETTYEYLKAVEKQIWDAHVYRLWLIFHFGCLWFFVLCLRQWLQPLQRLTEQQVRLDRL